MTITRKPKKQAEPPAKRDAIAEAFILAADKRAKTETTPPSGEAGPTKAKAKTKEKQTVAKPAAATVKTPAKAAKAKKEAAPTPASAPAAGAEPTLLEKEKKKKSKEKNKDKKRKDKKKKEAVLIRFEDDQLGKIDSQAGALGLSRAAWVRMVVSQALGKN
jgi:outer membrane biosynthesis protein TonB